MTQMPQGGEPSGRLVRMPLSTAIAPLPRAWRRQLGGQLGVGADPGDHQDHRPLRG